MSTIITMTTRTRFAELEQLGQERGKAEALGNKFAGIADDLRRAGWYGLPADEVAELGELVERYRTKALNAREWMRTVADEIAAIRAEHAALYEAETGRTVPDYKTDGPVRQQRTALWNAWRDSDKKADDRRRNLTTRTNFRKAAAEARAAYEALSDAFRAESEQMRAASEAHALWVDAAKFVEAHPDYDRETAAAFLVLTRADGGAF